MITSLGGGVGAGKFLKGLSSAVSRRANPPEKLSVIVNSADDIRLFGLRISPDIDTIIYWLSGMVDKRKGWGIEGDSFNFIKSAGVLGKENWFNIGDRDLATHIVRTEMMEGGMPLSGATREIARLLGADENADIMPMTDERVETWLKTDEGEMHFQEYYIRRKMEPRVEEITFRGMETAQPAPGVIEAIRAADTVVFCPSNPVISTGPILEVPGVRDELSRSRAVRAAVSPLVGGRALKGPADCLMKHKGIEASSLGVAEMYSDFIDLMVIDHADAALEGKIAALGMETLVTDTVMSSAEKSDSLARAVLEKADSLR